MSRKDIKIHVDTEPLVISKTTTSTKKNKLSFNHLYILLVSLFNWLQILNWIGDLISSSLPRRALPNPGI